MPTTADPLNVAYAAYDDGKLSRIALINLLEYNGTTYGTDPVTGSKCKNRRPTTTFTFPAVPDHTSARVAWLEAPQAHSNTSITLDGYMYSYAQGEGTPIKVKDSGGMITARDGLFSIDVPASGAAMLTLL